MSVRQQRSGSAAFAFLIMLMTFFIGALLLTLLNLPMQDLFDSQLFVFDTQYGTDLGNWLVEIWSYVGLLGVVAILYSGFVITRRE